MVDQKNNLNYSSDINKVDLYETRAVRNSRGVSYGKGRYRTYSGSSSSSQEWTKIARGTLTLNSDQCHFIGGGQQRIIERKNLVSVRYFSDTPGIEVAVSNRQKVMKFLLPGRTIEDGQRLSNAILQGQSVVLLSQNSSNFGDGIFSSIFKILIYLVLIFFLLFLFVFLVARLHRLGLILWILIVGLLIYYKRKN